MFGWWWNWKICLLATLTLAEAEGQSCGGVRGLSRGSERPRYGHFVLVTARKSSGQGNAVVRLNCIALIRGTGFVDVEHEIEPL
jgi:hypothetical protein